MSRQDLFLFEYVPRGSRVIIYGLGAYGRSYIEQIETTGWCEIAAVSDRAGEKQSSHRYPFVSTEKLSSLKDWDYLVLAIKDEHTSCAAYSELVRTGVQKFRILSHLERIQGFSWERETVSGEDDNRLCVLFLMTGGIGDAVMELSFYERLVDCCHDIIIDIYGEPYCKYFYSTRKNIRHIYNLHEFDPDPTKYDASFEANWGIRVWEYNLRKISRISPKLAERIEATIYDMRRGATLLQRIRLAQLEKRDRFWLMGRGNAWELSSDMIHVDMEDALQKDYARIGLRKYITINCGADNRKMQSRGGQGVTKVWPLSYFAKFVKEFREQYPDIEVVQIGGAGQESIPGVDSAILGESLELAKYVLKGSLLHIDDEGGLMHLATALGTKCVVLFGPTPMDILGYEQNINICANVCPGCFGVVAEWWRSCYRGLEEPPCMYSITSEMVLEKVKEFFDNDLICET